MSANPYNNPLAETVDNRLICKGCQSYHESHGRNIELKPTVKKTMSGVDRIIRRCGYCGEKGIIRIPH